MVQQVHGDGSLVSPLFVGSAIVDQRILGEVERGQVYASGHRLAA
jgi:hypothetical protein